jgi:hypothetical protein
VIASTLVAGREGAPMTSTATNPIDLEIWVGSWPHPCKDSQDPMHFSIYRILRPRKFNEFDDECRFRSQTMPAEGYRRSRSRGRRFAKIEKDSEEKLLSCFLKVNQLDV